MKLGSLAARRVVSFSISFALFFTGTFNLCVSLRLKEMMTELHTPPHRGKERVAESERRTGRRRDSGGGFEANTHSSLVSRSLSSPAHDYRSACLPSQDTVSK